MSDRNDWTPEEAADWQRMEDACRKLAEHFDSVHIFCTRHESGESGGTMNGSFGLGSWFARKGQIEEWLLKQDEITRADVRKNLREKDGG